MKKVVSSPLVIWVYEEKRSKPSLSLSKKTPSVIIVENSYYNIYKYFY